MACIKDYICVCTLFLAIIACHQVFFTEGGQLKKQYFNLQTTDQIGNSPGMVHSSKGTKPNSNYKQLIGDTSTVEGDERQVTGHSPGIGHSSHNINIGPNHV
ncbi:unnamed protein product [Withania somnifera]